MSEANQIFGYSNKRNTKEKSQNESTSKQEPQKIHDLINQQIGSSHVHVSQGNMYPPISTGYLKVTLIEKPAEGFLKEDGTIANIGLLKCEEIF
jgi:hypothetical protein